MLVSFIRIEPNVANITVNRVLIGCINNSNCKQLGVVLNDILSWYPHVIELYKKSSSHFHFVSQLKQTKLSAANIVQVYTMLVRPLLESLGTFADFKKCPTVGSFCAILLTSNTNIMLIFVHSGIS